MPKDKSPDNKDTNKRPRRQPSPYKVVVRRRKGVDMHSPPEIDTKTSRAMRERASAEIVRRKSAKTGRFASKDQVKVEKDSTYTTRRPKPFGTGFVIIMETGHVWHDTARKSPRLSWIAAGSLCGCTADELRKAGYTCEEFEYTPVTRR